MPRVTRTSTQTVSRSVTLPNGEQSVTTEVVTRTWTEYVPGPEDGELTALRQRELAAENREAERNATVSRDEFYDQDRSSTLSLGDIVQRDGRWAVYPGDGSGQLSTADADALVASAYHVCTLEDWSLQAQQDYGAAVTAAIAAYEAADPTSPHLAQLRTLASDIAEDLTLLADPGSVVPAVDDLAEPAEVDVPATPAYLAPGLDAQSPEAEANAVAIAYAAAGGVQVTAFGYSGAAPGYGRQAVELSGMPAGLNVAEGETYAYVSQFATANPDGVWSIHAFEGNVFARYTAPSGDYRETAVQHLPTPELPAVAPPSEPAPTSATPEERALAASAEASAVLAEAVRSGDETAIAAAEAAVATIDSALTFAQSAGSGVGDEWEATAEFDAMLSSAGAELERARAALTSPEARAGLSVAAAQEALQLATVRGSPEAIAAAELALDLASEALAFAQSPGSGVGDEWEATDEFNALLDEASAHLAGVERALALPEGALQVAGVDAARRAELVEAAEAVLANPHASSQVVTDALFGLFVAYPNPQDRDTELMLALVDKAEATLSAMTTPEEGTALQAQMDSMRELVRTAPLSQVLGITATGPSMVDATAEQVEAVEFATAVLTHPDATLRDVLSAQAALAELFPPGTPDAPVELLAALQQRGADLAINHATLLAQDPNASLEELQTEVVGFFHVFPDPAQRPPEALAAFGQLVARLTALGVAQATTAEERAALQASGAALVEQFRTQSLSEVLYPPPTHNQQVVAQAQEERDALLVGMQNITDPAVLYGYAEANAGGLFAADFLEFEAVGSIPDAVAAADVYRYAGAYLGVQPAGTGADPYPPGSPERRELDKIAEQIVEIGGPTPQLVAVPVMLNTEQTGPMRLTVFGVMNPNTGAYEYVDGQGRTYSSWEDWKKNNKLPPGRMYYPVEGAAVTPASPPDGEERELEAARFAVANTPDTVDTFGEHMVRVLDPLVTVGSLVVGGVFVVAGVLGTPLSGGLSLGLAVAGAGMAAYGMARAGSNLYDMTQHGGIELDPNQNSLLGVDVELNDPMAVPEMFNFVASGLGVFAFGSSARLLQLGRPAMLPRGLTVAMNVVDGATATVDYGMLALKWNELTPQERMYLFMQGTASAMSLGFSGYMARQSFRARSLPAAALDGPVATAAAVDGALVLAQTNEGRLLLDAPSGSSLLDASGGNPGAHLVDDGVASPRTGGPDVTGTGGPDVTGTGGPDVTGAGGPDVTGAGGPDVTGAGGPSFDWRQRWDSFRARAQGTLDTSMAWASQQFRERFGNIDWRGYAQRFGQSAASAFESVRTRLGEFDWRVRIDDWYQRNFGSAAADAADFEPGPARPAEPAAPAGPPRAPDADFFDAAQQRWSSLSGEERAAFFDNAGNYGPRGSYEDRLAWAVRELGLDPATNPTWADIRRAYRQLSREMHPDAVGPGGTEAFQRLNAANETLNIFFNGYQPSGVSAAIDPDVRYATGSPELSRFDEVSAPWASLSRRERVVRAFETLFGPGYDPLRSYNSAQLRNAYGFAYQQALQQGDSVRLNELAVALETLDVLIR